MMMMAKPKYYADFNSKMKSEYYDYENFEVLWGYLLLTTINYHNIIHQL